MKSPADATATPAAPSNEAAPVTVEPQAAAAPVGHAPAGAPVSARAPAPAANAPAPASSGLGKLVAKVKASFGTGAVRTEIEALAAATSRVAALEGALATATQSLTDLQATVTRTSAQIASICGPLALPVAEITGQTDEQIRARVAAALGRAATEKLAEIGQPAAELPIATGGLVDDLDTLRAQASETTDPVEKGKIAKRIRELKAAARARTAPAS